MRWACFRPASRACRQTFGAAARRGIWRNGSGPVAPTCCPRCRIYFTICCWRNLTRRSTVARCLCCFWRGSTRFWRWGRSNRRMPCCSARALDDAEVFRRRFDAALLLGTEDQACRTLLNTPELAPTYPTRIFCLAREGDWDTAAVTLETARALGVISDADDALCWPVSLTPTSPTRRYCCPTPLAPRRWCSG